MRYRQLSLCLAFFCLCLTPLVSAERNSDYVDGRAWVLFMPEYKLALIRTVQKDVRNAGLTTKYSAEFYLAVLNNFYGPLENQDIKLGDALSSIGFPLGDFERANVDVLSSEQ